MIDKALSIIKNIGDWYLMEHGTYIRIYGATKAPHLLPCFFIDKLVLQEISYQTVIHGVGVTLYHKKKDIRPLLPLWIGSYSFASLKQAQVEVDTLLSYGFGEEQFRRHDPKKVVKSIASRTSTLRSTLQLFVKKNKTIVEQRLMMRSLLEGRANHPPSNYSCKVFLNPLVYGRDYI
jgi:hypothetical protein